ncbi:ATP-binding protein [Roseibacillus ishigakijimensis]|uniref:histidine kinase n=1 Tax=Roseibacillus ishigakijimensis TaxID=454146 RepID=A0A934VLN9_9BACT|nr:ATP-binding protein [Roseibacillus ishigakijimensis]MBK1833296.1 response regulator [Roseibacillus ishigakijimensis]
MTKRDPQETRAERAAFLARFEAEDATTRIPNYRVASGLGAILMAAGSLMDRFAYPDLWEFLVLLRTVSSFLLLAIYAILGTPWGEKHHLALGHLMEWLLIAFILAMIAFTGGASSPYYAGLCLVMVGVSILLRWSLRHGIANVLLTCGSYTFLINVVPDSDPENHDRFAATSLYFLYSTGIIAGAGTHFLYELRMNEFRLREELREERKRLERSHAKLKDLDQNKTNFFANVSHELHTPLTLILGPIEQLTGYGPINNNPQLKVLVHSMEENGLRLLRLVNELLDIIRFDGGEHSIHPENTPIDEVMESIYYSILPTAEKMGLKLSLDLDDVPRGNYLVDRMKLEKVVLNLATNALKFTPAGGKVALKARTLGEEEVEFTVSDTGVGMSDEEQENVFRRFWQADASSKRRHRGTGLGLALVKSIVDFLGGSIVVESALGKGTTVRVRLPLGPALGKEEPVRNLKDLSPLEKIDRKAEFAATYYVEERMVPGLLPALPETKPDSESAPVILIAEDEPDVRQLIISQLPDYQILVASDGEQAIQMATHHQPELILLDWMMPEKDGLEVCRQVRQTPGLERVPVIMLTARIDERSKIEALGAGANDFLTKPFAPTELKLRIGHLLNAGRYEREVVQKSQELGAALAELKESESMLVQAEKLSSLGQMSAGIIHEINNPLNYAKTNLYALRSFAKMLPEEEREDFNEITSDVEEGLERVVQIVKDLRSFAVKDKMQFSDINLAEVVAASSRLLGNRLTQIDFSAQVPDHIHVNGNSNQLCQVFINFLQNSLDALREINRENQDGRIRVSFTELADSHSLHFEDNGCGISPENQKQIFDPFYSSKDIGQGMGLGLSICYRILEQHGVTIEIESEVNKGTRFTLKFPVIPEDDEADQPANTVQKVKIDSEKS